MATMTIFNIGRRTWLKDQVRGLTNDLPPQGNVELDEVAARRLVMDYPGEFSLVGKASPSTADLERREQSLRDREANLKAREAALDDREAAIKAREEATPANILNVVNADGPAPTTGTTVPDNGPTKAELTAQAQELGITVGAQWNKAKIVEAIAAKKAEQA